MRRNWLAFLFGYVILGALGCAAIYFGFGEMSDKTVAGITDTVSSLLPWKPATGLHTTNKAAVVVTTTEPASTPTTTTQAITTPRPTPTTVTAASAEGDVNWGIVTNEGARVYLLSGVFQGKLPSGTIVEVTETRDSEYGTLALFKMLRGERWSGPYLARVVDLDIACGAYANADRTAVQLRKQRARMLAELADAMNQQKALLRNANPYFADYKTARDAYAAYADKANAVQEKLDDATPTQRDKHLDALRRMQVEGTGLKIRYETLKRQYDARENELQTRSQDTPAMRTLRTRLTALNAQLRSY